MIAISNYDGFIVSSSGEDMLSHSVLNKSLLAIAGLFVCNFATAAMDEESSAPVYRFGGISAYPGFGLVLKNDSNIHRSSGATANPKISSMITVLSPSVMLQAQQEANKYSLNYMLDIGRYSNSSTDNYTDHKFLGQAELGLSSRSTLKLLPEFLIGHDDVGATYSTANSPNTWHSAGINGSFAYGAEDSNNNVVVDLGVTDRTYQNHRLLAEGNTAAYDRSTTNLGGTYFLKVWPKTSALLNVRFNGISYKQAGSTLNGTEQRILFGVKWEATAQTTGEVKVGQLQKKFDTTYQTHSGASWEGLVRWSPLTFVNVDFSSSKQPIESTLTTASTIMVSNTGANVAYDLTDRVSLHANFYQVKEDFVQTVRSDSTNNFGLKAEYKFRSWLIGGVEYTSSAKTSNVTGVDFNRNIFWVGVHSAL